MDTTSCSLLPAICQINPHESALAFTVTVIESLIVCTLLMYSIWTCFIIAYLTGILSHADGRESLRLEGDADIVEYLQVLVYHINNSINLFVHPFSSRAFYWIFGGEIEIDAGEDELKDNENEDDEDWFDDEEDDGWKVEGFPIWLMRSWELLMDRIRGFLEGGRFAHNVAGSAVQMQ